MAVTISDRVQSMIDYMEKGQFELALSDICIAIDITSQKFYKKERSSATTYKRFLKENMWMILMMGLGNVITPSIRVPFSHKDIELDAQGYCTLEQIIYHVMRCGFIHGTGEDSRIAWNRGIPLAIDPQGILHLSPSFIWGLALSVITCEANRDERVGESCWVSMASFKYFVNDLWGRYDIVRRVARTDFNISDMQY